MITERMQQFAGVEKRQVLNESVRDANYGVQVGRDRLTLFVTIPIDGEFSGFARNVSVLENIFKHQVDKLLQYVKEVDANADDLGDTVVSTAKNRKLAVYTFIGFDKTKDAEVYENIKKSAKGIKVKKDHSFWPKEID